MSISFYAGIFGTVAGFAVATFVPAHIAAKSRSKALAAFGAGAAMVLAGGNSISKSPESIENCKAMNNSGSSIVENCYGESALDKIISNSAPERKVPSAKVWSQQLKNNY